MISFYPPPQAVPLVFAPADAAPCALRVIYDGQIVLHLYRPRGTVPRAQPAADAAPRAYLVHLLCAAQAVGTGDIHRRVRRDADDEFLGTGGGALAAAYALFAVYRGVPFVADARRVHGTGVRAAPHTETAPGTRLAPAAEQFHAAAVAVAHVIVLVRRRVAARTGDDEHGGNAVRLLAEQFGDRLPGVGFHDGTGVRTRLPFRHRRRERVAACVAAAAAVRPRQMFSYLLFARVLPDRELLAEHREQHAEHHREREQHQRRPEHGHGIHSRKYARRHAALLTRSSPRTR